MKVIHKQIAIISTVAGIAVYYCEWLELIGPFCNQGLQFALLRMYVMPLLLAAVIGYIGFEKPMKCWVLFMIPSWFLRFIWTVKSIGNLTPPLIAIDLVHLILTGIILGIVAGFQRWRTVQKI